MPIYKHRVEKLEPFRPKTGDAGLYESEVEDLVWSFPEEIIGEPLFLVARQGTVSDGSRPDVIALDSQSQVVVIEVKRDFDRSQLAQALEYAGWATTTSLDEMATLYARQRPGEDFFEARRDYSETSTLEVLSPSPRMILVAQEFHQRTWSAIEFLNSSGTIVETREVTIHTGDDGETIVEVQGVDLPSGSAGPTATSGRAHYGVTLADLLHAGLLSEGEELHWDRPRMGELHVAHLMPGGVGLTMNGHEHATPSAAGSAAIEGRPVDGWEAWRVQREGEWVRINELRRRLLETPTDPEDG